MQSIKRILVPINGTVESTKALEFAIDLAQIYNAQINLLLVTYFKEQTDDTLHSKTWLDTPLTGSVSRFSQVIFNKISYLLPNNLQISTHHLSGQPQDKILEFAKNNDIDIIIMGCRNLSFFESILNGSVSRHVLEKSICPVIIVK